jgi:hypothetical protein
MYEFGHGTCATKSMYCWANCQTGTCSPANKAGLCSSPDKKEGVGYMDVDNQKPIVVLNYPPLT